MAEEEKQQFIEYKLQYGTGIQSRIQKIHNAMENYKSATSEFDNLITYLTDEIKDPIKPELLKISDIHKSEIHNIQNITVYPKSKHVWSDRHKTEHRLRLIFIEETDAINEMLPIIMNRLNKMGYLGVTKRLTEI